MMYSCLIVDDEAPARMMLSGIVNWASLGFSAPDLARNGEVALEMYEKNRYDVIFTDIQMPKMDGLELIIKVKEINPRQHFIVVSCHESFDYAQRSIKLGVSDYIIKDLINEEEITNLLVSMFAVKRNVKTLAANAKENLLVPFFDKGEYSNSDVLNSIGLGTDFIPMGFYLSIKVDGDEMENITKFKNMLSSKYNAVYDCSRRSYFVLTCIKDQKSQVGFMNDVALFSNELRSLSKSLGIDSLTIGISKVKNQSDIKNIFDTAREACGMKMFLGLDKNIFYDSFKDKKQIFNQEDIRNKISRFKDVMFKNGNYIEALSSIFSSNFSGLMQVFYYKYINDSLLGILLEYIRYFKLDIASLTKKNFRLNSAELADLETIKDMSNYFEEAVKIVLELNNTEANTLGEKVGKHIKKNIFTSISLASISEDLHFNKSYLSRAFKEETGVNIVDYINSSKIGKAKELLLQSNLKLSEISDSLCFSNQQYFSIVFKKEVGVSPVEFRKQAVNGQNIYLDI